MRLSGAPRRRGGHHPIGDATSGRPVALLLPGHVGPCEASRAPATTRWRLRRQRNCDDPYQVPVQATVVSTLSALGWLSAPRVHYAYEGFASYTVMCRTLVGDQRQAAGRSRDCGPHSAGNPSTEGQGVCKALPDTYHPTLSDWKRGRPPRRYASHGVESGAQLGEYSCRASARPRSCPPRSPSCRRTLGHSRRGHRHANSETAGHPAECHP